MGEWRAGCSLARCRGKGQLLPAKRTVSADPPWPGRGCAHELPPTAPPLLGRRRASGLPVRLLYAFLVLAVAFFSGAWLPGPRRAPPKEALVEAAP